MHGTYNKKSDANNMMMRRPRKKFKPRPGQPSDADLIKSFLEKNEITQCPPGEAIGSIYSTCHGLD